MAIVALIFILVLCNILRLEIKKGSKLNITAVVFFLLIFSYIGLPIILIEFYHKKTIGVTKGIKTVGRIRSHVVKFEYKINNEPYEGSTDLIADKNYLTDSGKYYVKYFPLFPSHGRLDFDDPVRE